MGDLTIQGNRADTPSPRRERHDGKDYLVVPVVALVEGVFNNSLHPLSEIQRSVPAWNGRPVVVHHPKANGTPISANDPKVLEQWAIGSLFNVNLDGSALKGELWVDVEKARKLGGDAHRALQWLEAGKPLEVSTGFFSKQTEQAGTHGERSYASIRTNMQPDHIAVLPGGTGACSWADGCGAPRINDDTLFERIKAAIGEAIRGLKPAALQTNAKEAPMPKKELVDALIANEATKFAETDREWLNGLDEARLSTLCPEQPKSATKDEPRTLSQEEQELLELGRRTLATEKARKATLVTKLVANKRNKLPEATLSTLSIDDLTKLDESLVPEDYSGRRPIQTNDKDPAPEGSYRKMPPVVLAKVEKKDAA